MTEEAYLIKSFKIKAFFQKYNLLFLLIVLYFIAEFLVNPIGEFPLNDDWSYSKSVLIFLTKGHIYIGSWCAMTLASHIVWGFAFVKAFGFSFFSLRLSNLISSLIGVIVLYILTYKLSKNKTFAFAASVSLLFNPIYFNLSNTFMTDINFNTWMLLAFYFVFEYFNSRRLIFLLLIFLMSLILVLNRQFGLILPLSFLITSFFVQKDKCLVIVFATCSLIAVYASLKWYESYLILSIPEWSAYKYSGSSVLIDQFFIKKFSYLFSVRYKIVLMSLLIYVSPLAILFLPSLLRKIGKAKFVLIVFLNVIFYIPFLINEPFPYGNVFTNMALGAETFYDDGSKHLYSARFEQMVTILKLVLVVISSSLISMYTLLSLNQLESKKVQHPFKIFLLVTGLNYLCFIFIPESFFDRYLLPLITVLTILLSYLSTNIKLTNWLALPVFLLMFYISVFGTKDYFNLNRIKWKAVESLKREKKIKLQKINGGFEVNCWDDGKDTWWVDYTKLDNFDYFLGYSNQKGFTLYKEFEFQRYFPYKKDKINIFVRDSIK